MRVSYTLTLNKYHCIFNESSSHFLSIQSLLHSYIFFLFYSFYGLYQESQHDIKSHGLHLKERKSMIFYGENPLFPMLLYRSIRA